MRLVANLSCVTEKLNEAMQTIMTLTHLEDVIGVDEAKARLRGLQVVNSLAHVAVRRKEQSFKTIIRVRCLNVR